MTRHLLGCGAAAVLTIFTFAGTAQAQTEEVATAALPTVSASEAAYRVNLAGRQRMLSQRMAKSACLMASGIDTETHYDQMAKAFALFETSDMALRDGDPERGLQPERYRRVLNALEKMDVAWGIYAPLIRTGVDARSMQVEDMTLVNSASVEVLKLMNDAVNMTARAYGSVTPDVPLTLTITVDVAGRQRMLTQRAVKQACLLRVTDDPVGLAEALSSTIGIFDISLTALRQGMAEVGVMAAPNAIVADKLAEVQTLWTPVKALLDRAAAGEALPDADLAKLAELSEPLLRTMNEAVGLYETVGS
ncbi:MAG: type IV pili methyl-accepting chemotaxis transducer N-terminal domain-containing protein [Pseudomonadota bacterium]